SSAFVLGLPDAASGHFGRRQARDLPVPVCGVSVHARGLLTARGPGAPRDIGAPRVAFRQPPRRRHPGVAVARTTGPWIFAAQYPACASPCQRFTPPCERRRMTRGRCGSLPLHRTTLSFATPRRFDRRTEVP